MELNEIEILIEKYFDGETTIEQENKLRTYFLSDNVASHLQQYQAIFGFYADAKKEKAPVIELRETRSFSWYSVAASVVILIGVGTFAYFNTQQNRQDLGSFNDPQIAFEQTQQALDLLSGKVNQGIQTVEYVDEYNVATDRIFNFKY